jgi:hypothetical protein
VGGSFYNFTNEGIKMNCIAIENYDELLNELLINDSITVKIDPVDQQWYGTGNRIPVSYSVLMAALGNTLTN